jgi:hypothetical protein
MSKADDYCLRIELSTIRAELASTEELRISWLRIRESWEHLLSLEASLLQDHGWELLALSPAPEAGHGSRS